MLPFEREEGWGSEKLKHLPKVIQNFSQWRIRRLRSGVQPGIIFPLGKI